MNNNNLTKENKRKATVLLIFGALVLIVLVAGSTYAYFQAQVGNGTSANINATTGTVDDLRFEKGEDITFEANMTNFAEGLGNVSGSTTSKAILTANNATNSAKEDYYVYVNIITNEIEYTSYKKDTEIKVFKTKEEKEAKLDTLTDYEPRPELILSIKGPDGYIVGSGDSLYKIEGLDYYDNIETKVNGSDEGQKVSGYDITETTGLIKIELKEPSTIGEGYNYSAHIETDESNHDTDVTKPPYRTTQEWEIKVTFINLDSDQNLNTNKSFNGNVILQKEEKKEEVSLADACVGKALAECIKENYELDETIVYHNGTIKYPEDLINVNDDSLLKNGYKITDEYKDDYIALYASSSSDDLNQKYLIRFNCNSEEIYIGKWCLSTYPQYYYLDYNKEKTFETFKEALQQAIKDKYVEPKILDAEDYSYRYTGSGYTVGPTYRDKYPNMSDIIKHYDGYGGSGNDFSYYYWVPDNKQYFTAYGNGTPFEINEVISYGLEKGYIVERPIKNYICFDELENGVCAEEDLYQILGIFPKDESKSEYEMKVVKATLATKEQLGEEGAYAKCDDDYCINSYYWNSSKGTSYDSGNTNNWRDSNLNKENLNGYFWNTYLEGHNPMLKNMIANHTWIVSGIDLISDPVSYAKESYNIKESYDEELGKNKLKIEDPGCMDNEGQARNCLEEDLIYPYQGLDEKQITKIGLMYISDYGYTTSADLWCEKLNGFGSFRDWSSQSVILLYSWLQLNDNYDNYETTITKNQNNTDEILKFRKRGSVFRETIFQSEVRPSFYLESSVKLASGDGSKESPYRVNL